MRCEGRIKCIHVYIAFDLLDMLFEFISTLSYEKIILESGYLYTTLVKPCKALRNNHIHYFDVNSANLQLHEKNCLDTFM